MDTFILDKKLIALLLTTLFTGLLAGVFFIWTNAITPGIGKLDDVSYLRSFQNMNRTIINPLFYIVIISPIFLSPLSAYLYKSNHSFMFWAIVGASIFYFLGVFVVTMIGNIPLNILLEKINLSEISVGDAKIMRDKFEVKWNNLHLIRTITSSVSFLLLILACLARTENKIIN
ncbi:DUF1772 domain-containing protein [Flavobacterium polysaccharolyticum]|uniref:DUF1772 domain-containing protein n=1 Tax=Flavobacterium polysaccharolyticum TaxID=3133148 RepID=A0ABU9NKI6_9FLAO